MPGAQTFRLHSDDADKMSALPVCPWSHFMRSLS